MWPSIYDEPLELWLLLMSQEFIYYEMNVGVYQ